MSKTRTPYNSKQCILSWCLQCCYPPPSAKSAFHVQYIILHERQLSPTLSCTYHYLHCCTMTTTWVALNLPQRVLGVNVHPSVNFNYDTGANLFFLFKPLESIASMIANNHRYVLAAVLPADSPYVPPRTHASTTCGSYNSCELSQAFVMMILNRVLPPASLRGQPYSVNGRFATGMINLPTLVRLQRASSPAFRRSRRV